MSRIRSSEIHTRVFCILSDERAYRSNSPRMFMHVFGKLGLHAAYVPFCIRAGYLGEALHSLKVLGIAGANVTVPYKEMVIPHLNVLSEGAKIIGAVNTIVPDGDGLKGYNTNAIGFMNALEETGYDVTGKSVLVFGTGGIARAIVFILNWLRADKIWINGRSAEKVAHVTSRIAGSYAPAEMLLSQAPPVDLVINATSVATAVESADLAHLVRKLDLPVCRLIVDVNYGRETNLWQALAAEKNVAFLDGLSTLAHQARASLALWTGADVPATDFLDALQHTSIA